MQCPPPPRRFSSHPTSGFQRYRTQLITSRMLIFSFSLFFSFPFSFSPVPFYFISVLLSRNFYPSPVIHIIIIIIILYYTYRRCRPHAKVYLQNARFIADFDPGEDIITVHNIYCTIIIAIFQWMRIDLARGTR